MKRNNTAEVFCMGKRSRQPWKLTQDFSRGADISHLLVFRIVNNGNLCFVQSPLPAFIVPCTANRLLWGIYPLCVLSGQGRGIAGAPKIPSQQFSQSALSSLLSPFIPGWQRKAPGAPGALHLLLWVSLETLPWHCWHPCWAPLGTQLSPLGLSAALGSALPKGSPAGQGRHRVTTAPADGALSDHSPGMRPSSPGCGRPRDQPTMLKEVMIQFLGLPQWKKPSCSLLMAPDTRKQILLVEIMNSSALNSVYLLFYLYMLQ